MFTLYIIVCLLLLVLLGYFSLRMFSDKVWVAIIPFIVFSYFGIVSSLYLESGVYVFEQDRVTNFSGSTIRLIIIFFWFWCCFGITYKVLAPPLITGIHSVSIKKLYLDLSLSVSAIIMAVAFVNIYITGDIPFFSTGYINRFEYLQNTKLWYLLKVFGVSTTIIPLLSGVAYAGYSAISVKSGQILCILMIVFYLIYMSLLGNKFGGLVYGVYYFIMPILLITVISSKNIKKTIVKYITYGILFITPVFGLVYYHYSTYPLSEEYGGPFKFILYRIFALQGHLWWGIDHHIFLDGNSHMFNFSEAKHAMPTMMRIVSGTWIESAIERGVSFTFGFPASPLLFFGVTIGIVVIGIIAAFMAFIAKVVVSSILDFDLIKYVLSAYLMIWISNAATMGSLEIFVQLKFLVIFTLFCIYLLMKTSIQPPKQILSPTPPPQQ